MPKILITGATGQIGSELTPALRQKYGGENVVAVGHRKPPLAELKESGPYEQGDATDKKFLTDLISKYKVDTIYHLVGILSAAGEQNPDSAWVVNINSLKNVLDLAKEHDIEQVFWPSSIAAFGPSAPRANTPQATIMDPTTIYGITKYSGELLCNYYYNKYRVDVRSLRYPGLISYVTPPGGGTTDYAIAIFIEALQAKKYTCYLREDTELPMMYMPDAIKALTNLANADRSRLKHRVFNVNSMSFSSSDLAESIKNAVPSFACSYKPDYRQAIADTWPTSLNDSAAREEWDWKPTFALDEMTKDMIEKLRKKLSKY